MRRLGRHGEVGADLLERADKLVLHDDGGRHRVVDHVADLLADQAEVDRHHHQTGFRRCDVDLRPFDRVIGEHRHTIALDEAKAQESIGEPAGPRVPLMKRHAALEVARPDFLCGHARVSRQHLTEKKFHAGIEYVLHGWAILTC